jgi:hypothetical protein
MALLQSQALRKSSVAKRKQHKMQDYLHKQMRLGSSFSSGTAELKQEHRGPGREAAAKASQLFAYALRQLQTQLS